MSNSPLVNYTKISPNSTNPRNNKIKKITIHHMAGIATVEQCGAVFAPKSRRASSNYGIDSNGRVGMYVEEKNRSWCSSSSSNDNQAITIEVSNDVNGGNWHVSDKALAKLIDLCVDICERNNIPELNFTGDTSGNLTMHKWFAPTACPGEYLESKFPYIAAEVNKRLQKKTTVTTPKEKTSKIKKGDLVKLSSSAVYYDGKQIPDWVKNSQWYVKSVSGDRAVINEDKDKQYAICSPINTEYLTVVSATTSKKSVTEIAKEVIAGKWGSGDDRKKRLTDAGYNYSTVQAKVNALLKSGK